MTKSPPKIELSWRDENYGSVCAVAAFRNYAGSLDGTPVFLGCSDVDSHVPKWRVEESAGVLGAMGADVTLRLYEGMGHLVNDDEIGHARTVIQRAMV